MENTVCITWDEPGGEHNSDMFTLEELARALATGAFTGSTNITIELVPVEEVELKGDPHCEQCHGKGCAQCNDAIHYAEEEAANQYRRDRDVDFARRAFDVEF